MSRPKFPCRDRGWSRLGVFMSRQSVIVSRQSSGTMSQQSSATTEGSCRDKVTTESFLGTTGCLSVATGFGQALRCVTTSLGAHDRDALSRQTSYSDKKK